MNFVIEQWGRFVWWAGQNAGAIQAMSGVGTLLLTAALTYVTWKYVQLTSAIANLNRSQLELNRWQFEHDLQPQAVFPTFEIDDPRLIAKASIRNAGSRPFRVISVSVACYDGRAKQPLFPRMELSPYRDTVVAPGSDLSVDAEFGLILKLSAPEQTSAVEAARRYHVWLILWCCDLAHHQDHTYIYRADTRDILYFKGKITPEQLNERFDVAANHGIKIPDGLKRVRLDDPES